MLVALLAAAMAYATPMSNAELQALTDRAERKVLATYKNTGSTGLESEVVDCYKHLPARATTYQRAYCLAEDVGGYHADQSFGGEQMARDYFKTEAFAKRLQSEGNKMNFASDADSNLFFQRLFASYKESDRHAAASLEP